MTEIEQQVTREEDTKALARQTLTNQEDSVKKWKFGEKKLLLQVLFSSFPKELWDPEGGDILGGI